MSKQSKIFLLGFMGCGKSSIGKKLAAKLNYHFIDLDSFIEEQENCPITSIFTTEGEDYFRSIEKKSLNFVSKLPKKVVIALGGGTPCFFDNMSLIKSNGIAIYLKYNSGILANRLLNAKTERPLIKNKTKKELLDFIDNSLLNREKYYAQSNFIIENNNIKVSDLMDILSKNNCV